MVFKHGSRSRRATAPSRRRAIQRAPSTRLSKLYPQRCCVLTCCLTVDTALAVTLETISLDATQEKMSLDELRNAVKKVSMKSICRHVKRMNKHSVSASKETASGTFYD